MKEFFRKAAILAAIGFALGMLVGLVILSFHGGLRQYYAQRGRDAVVLYLAVSALLGAVNMGSAAIYTLEHWGALRCTLIHFAIAMGTVCAAGFPMDWFSLRDPATLWILGGCVVLYFIIWVIMYIQHRRQVRRMNEALKRWKAEQGDR